MSSFRLQDFVNSLGAATTGAIQGQIQGAAAAREQQQQALALSEGQQRLEAQQREATLAPYTAPLAHINLLDPASQATLLGDVSRAAGGGGGSAPPSKVGPTGPMAPLSPPQPSPAPAPVTPVAAGMRVGGVESEPGTAQAPPPSPAAAPAPGASLPPTAPAPAPGATPATAKPQATFTVGGHTYTVGGRVDKARLSNILLNQRQILSDAASLPETDPRRVEIERQVSGIDLFPQTDEEATASENALVRARFLTPKNVPGQQRAAGAGLEAARKALGEAIDRIPSLQDPASITQALIDATNERRSLTDQAKRAGQTIVLPPALAGSEKEIDQIETEMQSGDPSRQQKAIAQAQVIAGRIHAHLTPPQETAAMQRVFQYSSKLSPRDPQYDEKVQAFIHARNLDYLFPGGARGMAGAAQEKSWQSWLARLHSAADLDPVTQRLILGEGRALAVATGRKPGDIPAEVTKQLTPEQRIAALKLQDYDTTRAQADQKFATEQREAQLRIQGLEQKNAPGTGNLQALKARAQTQGVQYLQAHQAVERLRAQEMFYPADLLPGATHFARHPEVLKQIKDALALEQHTREAYDNTARRIKALSEAPAPARPQGATGGGGSKTTTGTASRAPQSRAEWFAYIKRNRPQSSAQQINQYLDRKGIR